jgi:hypothetical protein
MTLSHLKTLERLFWGEVEIPFLHGMSLELILCLDSRRTVKLARDFKFPGLSIVDEGLEHDFSK